MNDAQTRGPPRLPRDGEAGADESWARVFSAYGHVVLVANSDVVDIADLKTRYAENTLFVFFNKVYKVLSEPFDRPSLLVARSSPAGANIVYRREVDQVVGLLRSRHFLGVLNLRAGSGEVFSPAPDFGGVAVGHLDLAPSLDGFYPPTHVATSGFALALFLVERSLPGQVVLAGFTARRSRQWKLFHDHDWTFEQVVLRLLVRSGRLQLLARTPEAGSFHAIAARLDDVAPGDVGLVAGEVLAERLEGAHIAIDGLLRLTRLQRTVDAALRRLKPRTRKAKLADEAAARR